MKSPQRLTRARRHLLCGRAFKMPARLGGLLSFSSCINVTAWSLDLL